MLWTSKLAYPIKLRDGRELRTLGDAAELILRLSESSQRHAWTEHAARLLMVAAESGGAKAIKDASAQVHLALKREGFL